MSDKKILNFKIKKLKSSGKTHSEIAEALNCSKNTIYNSERQRRRQANKLKLINMLGGKCVICGYNSCSAALQFHHTDPKKKHFAISDNTTNKFEKLQEEAKKCILLCANCHAEVEYGVTTFSTLTKIESMSN